MNILLLFINIATESFNKPYLLKGFSFLNLLMISDYQLVINVFLIVTIIVLLFFLVVIAKNLKGLKKSSQANQTSGKEWINEKLSDFNTQQLDALIQKINKVKNDQPIKPEN
jgi:hypothetical protein